MKTRRKFLIYLLTAMMLLPTWLVTGIINAPHAKASIDSPMDPILSEVYVSGDNDWIEVYNPNAAAGGSIDLTGYQIKFKTSTLDKVFKIDESIIVNPGEQAVIDKDQFDVDLDLSDTHSSAWRQVSFLTPGGLQKQITVEYGDGGLSPVVDKSLQYRNADGVWFVDNENPGEYTVTLPTVDIAKNPDLTVSSAAYTVTLTPENAAETKYKMNDGAWTNYTLPITVSAEGEYVVYAEAIDGIGQIALDQDTFTIDATAPVITLNGESEITIEKGSVFVDPGASVVDNLDSTVTVSVSGSVDTSLAGDYTLTYEAADLAGNLAIAFTRLVHVIEPVQILAPEFSVTQSETDAGNKIIKVDWEGVGGAVDGYQIYINGITSDSNYVAASNLDDLGIKYSKEVSVLSYGKYEVLVKSVKGALYSSNTVTKAVEFIEKAPVVEETVEVVNTPVAVENPIAPQPAKAAEPKVEQVQPPAAPSDENGIIKGDETNKDEEEKVNWTPWIVLFVLILLAGAITGGYFYWFNGEDEVTTVINEPKKEKKTIVPQNVSKSKKPNKKSKRW